MVNIKRIARFGFGLLTAGAIATGALVAGATSASAATPEVDFDTWVKHFNSISVPSQDGVYLGHESAWLAEDLRGVAKDYPGTDKHVPASLRDAATHLDKADKKLAKRQYGAGRTELKDAAEALKPVEAEILADWKKSDESGFTRTVAWDGSYMMTKKDQVVVVKWLDGQTVETDQGVVRLIGIKPATMADRCSTVAGAAEAKQFAETLAPVGSTVTISRDWSRVDADSEGRLWRYVDTRTDHEPKSWLNENNVDIGYSELKSGLAVPGNDDEDGGEYHSRQNDYRATEYTRDANPQLTKTTACLWAAAVALDDDDHSAKDRNDSDVRDLRRLLDDFHWTFKKAAKLPKTSAMAKADDTQSDKTDRAIKQSRHVNGGGSGGGGGNRSRGFCSHTRWC